MAFNGSAHVPRGEMVNILERHGLAFGADTNASTSWDETVYKLNLPKADEPSLDDSLMLLREDRGRTDAQPGRRSIRKKGVVLVGGTAAGQPLPYRSVKASLGFDLEGQLAAKRFSDRPDPR